VSGGGCSSEAGLINLAMHHIAGLQSNTQAVFGVSVSSIPLLLGFIFFVYLLKANYSLLVKFLKFKFFEKSVLTKIFQPELRWLAIMFGSFPDRIFTSSV
jgi:hypothetical protein